MPTPRADTDSSSKTLSAQKPWRSGYAPSLARSASALRHDTKITIYKLTSQKKKTTKLRAPEEAALGATQDSKRVPGKPAHPPNVQEPRRQRRAQAAQAARWKGSRAPRAPVWATRRVTPAGGLGLRHRGHAPSEEHEAIFSGLPANAGQEADERPDCQNAMQGGRGQNRMAHTSL